MPHDDPFQQRLHQLRVAIGKLGSQQLGAYATKGKASHHERLAMTLIETYGDATLAEVGFLHGVPMPRLAELELAPEEGVEAILDGWERLRRPREEEQHKITRRELIEEVLPGLPEPRAAFLLAEERLDRWDPRRQVLDWTRQFRTAPLDVELRSRPRARSAELAHLRDVAAPVAEFCGLWDVRNTLENLALLHADRGKFRGVVGWVRHCHAEGITAAMVRAVEKSLSVGHRDRSPARWEWRHAASIANNVDIDRPGGAKIGRLWRCGYVTIECANTPACYRVLGLLHAAESLRYQPDGVLDTIGRPTRAGYRALRTIVTAEVLGRHIPIAIRLIPRQSRSSEETPTPWKLLQTAMRAAESRTEGIVVYTPAGAFKRLPAGATVLNFAAAVHSDFVGTVDHAIVNERDRVGVLHKLSDGDRVELIKAEVPSLPPVGWEEEVPPDSLKSLRTLLRANMSPVLQAEGLRWLRGAMTGRGLTPVADEAVLESLLSIAVEVAAESLGLKNPRTTDWWKEQLGLWSVARRGDDLPYTPSIDDRKVEVLEESLAGVLDNLQYREDELELGEGLRGGARRILKCPECRPAAGGRMVVTLDGETVVVHDAEADCAEGGHRMRVGRTPTLQQYFVVETTNRSGVTLDLLSVFNEAKVDVVDIAGRRLGPGWAVIRVEAELVGPPQIRAILRELRKIAGVHRVRGPGQAPLEILEGGLPPRPERPPEPWALPQPYVCGDFVREDHAFYGRTEELAELERALAYVVGSEAEAGGLVFVQGPLKTGKTSLAKRFLRDLNRRPGPQAIGVFVKARVGESWPELEARLAAQLADSAAAWSVRESSQLPRKLPETLEELLQVLRASIGSPVVVLVIDEAIRPLRRAHTEAADGDRGGLDAILRFEDLIEGSPGTLVVFVGPRAPVRRLHPELARILRAAEPVVMRGFDWEDAQRLLTATKMAWRYPIEVKKGLARATNVLCGGNPFWINHLAYLMYRRESRRAVRPIRYSHALLKDASDELVHQTGFFEDRLFPDGVASEAPPWVWPLVRLLCADSSAGTPDDGGRKVSVLHAELSAEGIELTVPEVADAIEDLVAMGGLQWTVDQAGEHAVRIAAPLLARFVRMETARGRRGGGRA
ncbi:MAG: TGS domain-containing protein [Proteobacteria bacterium]|nr:TGS domain-containing protein [Pseudomonadota bacterium]